MRFMDIALLTIIDLVPSDCTGIMVVVLPLPH